MTNWAGRYVDVSADIDTTLRELAMSMDQPANVLYEVAISICLIRWQGPDGEKLMRDDMMLYKLTKP